ncbi:MAG: LUD domain-containing protein [Pseudomonadota bacterium]|nr:LUD domain-containing protein [Pseudomonadota bacterium]
MSEARAQILDAIRRRLKRAELPGQRRAELDRRLQEPPRHRIPARSLLPHAERLELFVKMALEAAATVDRAGSMAAVPRTVEAFLKRETLPLDVVLAPAVELAGLPWDETDLTVRRGRAGDGDRVTVTPAFAGIAETGTLMLLSGPHSPTTLNFLPDVHIVVLKTSRIVGPYEDAWTLLRREKGAMPRTVNLITGPSRSADIEQTLQLGAHGPVRLHIVLVGE